MKYKIIKPVLLTIFLTVFAALTGCDSNKGIKLTNLQTEGDYSSGAIVQSINFINKQSFKDKTLIKQLDFKVGDKFDSILIDSGRYELSEFYRKRGFAEVKVNLDTSELSKGRITYIIDSGPRFKIKSVKFTGNKLIKTSDLQSTIKTKTRGLFFRQRYYKEEKVAADVKKLQEAYYLRGFLNYDIQVLGRSDITFLIDEGLQYKVGNVQISGNKKFDKDTLLAKFDLKTGDIFYPLRAQVQAKRILQIYRENGFVEATVKQQHNLAKVDADVVDVEFNIIEGRQFRIGKIEIAGNEQTQDKVLRRVFDEYGFSPGEFYNADIAPPEGGGNLEKRARNATLSEEVSITPVIPEPNQENRLDAMVNVKEGLTGMWNPGIAYGSDNGLSGMLNWSQRNFDITDWPESFNEFISMQAFKGAGQRLLIDLQPGNEVSTYSVSFTEPYFRNRPTSLNVTGSSWERWYSSHDEKRTKGTVSFQKRYRNLWRTNLGFRVENVDIGNIDYDAPLKIKDYKGDNLLLGTKLGFGRDETDDIYLPTRGYVFNVDYEYVTGDDDFGILEGSGVFYKTLYQDFRERKTILATKILTATNFSDAPFYEQFYAGGIGTYGIRGFRYRGISTRGLQTNVANPIYHDPIGSDWIFLANTEVAVPLIGDNVSLLFFVDSGTIDTGPYRISAGTGLQIMVPQFFGPVPIRFTFAEPLRKDDDDERQSFNFFMGGMFQY
ncbi:MAG: outer membrane protein assembly factor [Sedimentisphaerales bacterium]|nr:outer membrane protein assembly factor [Sedimentisphaerales bacterium]